MAIQTFSSGQTLTAAQMNSLQANDYNQTVSAKTTSYTLVAGDVGTHVQMTASTATTISVPAATFAAGDSLFISSQGAGACTIQAASTAITVTGLDKVLEQYQGGTLRFQSASAATFFSTPATATTSGLSFITSATFSAVASVSLPADTFSSTYTNYKIVFNCTADAMRQIFTRLRAAGADNTVAEYRQASVGVDSAATGVSFTGLTNTSFSQPFAGSGDPLNMSIDIFAPKLTERTYIHGHVFGSNSGPTQAQGYALNQAFFQTTSFDSFTFFVTAGNITGNYKVYGYANS